MPMPTGRIARSARIAVIPIGLAGRSLAGRIRVWRGADPLETWAQVREANADSLRDSLGALKGGALKAGQLLSTVDSLFPADPDRTWESALTQLQEANPALPFADSAGVLREEWGSAWRSRFDEFDPVPVAAASLGQVFRARWNGRDVAVKVQYPGIREAIESDVALLAWALRAGSLVARGLVVPPVIDELRSRLTDELDYVREADHQNQFAAAYADDSDVVVPRAVEATPRVLVTEWLPGSPLVDAVTAPDGVRNQIGQRYQRFLLSAPARVGLLHADPHPGNFRVLADGRLGVLDFGAVVPMPEGMPESFGRLIRVMLCDDPAEVDAGLHREGFVRPGVRIDAVRLAAFLAPFSEPARCETFTYSPEWLRSHFTRGPDDARNPDYAIAMKLTIPADQLLTHRVWLGCVGVLSRLRSTVEVAPELRRWLPGFAG